MEKGKYEAINIRGKLLAFNKPCLLWNFFIVEDKAFDNKDGKKS